MVRSSKVVSGASANRLKMTVHLGVSCGRLSADAKRIEHSLSFKRAMANYLSGFKTAPPTDRDLADVRFEAQDSARPSFPDAMEMQKLAALLGRLIEAPKGLQLDYGPLAAEEGCKLDPLTHEWIFGMALPVIDRGAGFTRLTMAPAVEGFAAGQAIDRSVFMELCQLELRAFINYALPLGDERPSKNRASRNRAS